MKRNGDGADSVVPKTKRLGGTVLSARQKIANPSCRPASCLRTFWEGRIRDGGAVPMGNKKKKNVSGVITSGIWVIFLKFGLAEI
jgi:hypothetical protein